MGYKGNFKGLGVLFDTFPNNPRPAHGFPYISVVYGDGTKQYNHLDDGISMEIGGCEADFRAKSYSTRAKITYLAGTVEVLIDSDGEDEWKSCAKIKGIKLNPMSYVGFTAATGEVFDAHKILSVTTVEVFPGSFDYFSMHGEVHRSSSTWIILLIFFCVIGFLYYYMKKRQSSSKNRLL